MKNCNYLFLSLGILLCQFSPVVFAEQVELTPKLIKNWMNSQRSLEDWGKLHEKTLSSSPSDDKPQDTLDMSVASMLSPLKEKGLYDDANQVIQEHEFSNIEEWAALTLRITTAAAALEFESNPEIMDTSALEALTKSSQINDEQKQMLTNAIEQNRAMVKQVLSATNEVDKKAVQPYMSQIMSMMDEPY